MNRIDIRCLLVCFAFQLLSGSSAVAAPPEWDGKSAALKLGSIVGSFVFQPYGKGNCAPGAKDGDASGCRKQPDGSLATTFRRRDAFEFEFGKAELDETTDSGERVDVSYASAGLRYYFWKDDVEDRLRFFVGVSLGYYDVDDFGLDDMGSGQVGSSVKLGGDIGLTSKISRNCAVRPVHLRLEFDVIHHRLESGQDFSDFRVGLRFFFRSKYADRFVEPADVGGRCNPAATGGN